MAVRDIPRITNQINNKKMNILNKIKSVKLCLMAHPDNEINSEFADRIADLEEIEDELSKDNWIEIDDKLPKEMPIDIIINGMPYQGWVYKGQGGLFCCVENRYLSKHVDEIVEVSRISHYQPIIKPDLPLT